MTELKPCPFCGDEARLMNRYIEGDYAFIISCRGCEAMMWFYDSEESVINTWNCRADGWISVDDALPENDADVLVCLDSGFMGVGYYIDEGKDGVGVWQSGGMLFLSSEITHWMPLLQPPHIGDQP